MVPDRPSDGYEEVFEPTAIIAALNRHGVRYLVIGAFAAQLQGAPLARTRDIDLTPATEPDNLDRLSAALHDLGANIRAAEPLEGVRFDHDGASLGRVRVWNLICRFGEFDISFTPSGTEGYDDLARRAVIVEHSGHAVPVAHLEDVIRSKEAARRPKDIVHLPILMQTAERLRRRRPTGSRVDADS